MLYFLQTPIPKKRQVYKGLLAIYGLGQTTVNKLVGSLGLLEESRATDLRNTHIVRLKSILNDYPGLLAAELRNKNKTAVQRLINIASYRGRRHKHAYPVRGQRTHTNAKTQKRLYRRWLINTYEKAKQSFKNPKSLKKPLAAKKAKKATPSKVNKKQPAKAPKAPKYKI
jgi:small subunit ribosomal protein S13